MNTTPTLHVENLVKTYGGVQAVRGVSFDVMPQTIVGLEGYGLSVRKERLFSGD